MIKNTEQKRIIMHALKPGYFPTADELLTKIKKNHPDFSRATLYRNLTNFCNEGELKKISAPGKTDRYTTNVDCHYHLICEYCGKIEELNMPNAIKTPEKLKDYDVTYHELTFFGICPDCQEEYYEDEEYEDEEYEEGEEEEYEDDADEEYEDEDDQQE